MRDQGFSILERVPVLKVLLISNGLGATARILASLLRGGVHFLQGVAICERGTQSPLVRGFWEKVRGRTESGEVPASSMNDAMLYSSERLLIRAHQDQKQLAEALESMADSREEEGTAAAKKFSMVAFVASLAYSGIAVLFSLFVVYLQNETVLTAGM
ncbi:MAG: type II secretion system F family protein [Limnobacter sp.]|nr:type II secretion system F family protein [Limnobacter sp.]